MLTEDIIIKSLKKSFPKYIGDDCSIIQKDNNIKYLTTKDLLVENIHFRTSYFSPEALAHKSLHVNLSDLAAMGAKPKYIMLGISIPKNKEVYMQKFLEYFIKKCKELNIELIGGDTTKSTNDIFISITAFGQQDKEFIKYRDNINEGDYICLIGNIGYSLLGLIALEQKQNGFEYYKNFCLCPNAKIEESLWLCSKPQITGLIDISDGLYLDLKNLSESSNIEIDIDIESLPKSEDFINSCVKLAIDPIETILSSGEDYSLLCSVKAEYFAELNKNFKKIFKYEIIKIGTAKNKLYNSINFLKNKEKIKPIIKPFSHFGI